MREGSNAYDLSKFEEKSKLESIPELKLIQSSKISKVDEKLSLIKICSTTFVMVVVIAVLINSRIALMEATSEIAAMQAEYDVLKNEHTTLTSRIESETSLRNIEEQAKSFGMSKLEEDQVIYRALEEDDEIVITKNSNSIWDKVVIFINNFLEYLS